MKLINTKKKEIKLCSETKIWSKEKSQSGEL